MTPEELFSDDNISSYIADNTGIDREQIKKVLYIGNTWFASMLRPIAQASRDATAMNLSPDITLDAIGALEDLRFVRINNGEEPDPDDTHIDRITSLTNLPPEIIMEIGTAFLKYFEGVFESFKGENTKDDS